MDTSWCVVVLLGCTFGTSEALPGSAGTTEEPGGCLPDICGGGQGGGRNIGSEAYGSPSGGGDDGMDGPTD